jgi:hypothetical protein
LRIEIEEGGFHAPLLGRHRQVDADGRFAGTAFLTDDGGRFHDCALIGCIVCNHTCKHRNPQANCPGQGSRLPTGFPATAGKSAEKRPLDTDREFSAKLDR